MKPRSRPNGEGASANISKRIRRPRRDLAGRGDELREAIDVLLKALDTYDFDQRLQYLEERAAAQS